MEHTSNIDAPDLKQVSVLKEDTEVEDTPSLQTINNNMLTNQSILRECRFMVQEIEQAITGRSFTHNENVKRKSSVGAFASINTKVFEHRDALSDMMVRLKRLKGLVTLDDKEG